jgi:MinD-like ATPase involved in chromosome partitioning or flagellar assembly
MNQVISIHSFYRGVGKSHLCANLAASLASLGRRCCVVDCSRHAPAYRLLYNLNPSDIHDTFNDFLAGSCPIDRALYPVNLPGAAGQLWLSPSTPTLSDEEPDFSPERLKEIFLAIHDTLKLDFLVLDNFAGINEETLTTMAFSDSSLILMALDPLYYQGTSVMVDVARKLEIDPVFLIPSQIPAGFPKDLVAKKVEDAFAVRVLDILPFTEQIDLSRRGFFLLENPRHPLSLAYRNIARQIVGVLPHSVVDNSNYRLKVTAQVRNETKGGQ